MKRLAGVLALMSAFAAYGCMSSTLVLHVMPDGSGRAVITTRVFESSRQALDSLGPVQPGAVKEVKKLEELLPAPREEQLERQFGTRVHLVSTTLDRAVDGGIRTTIVDFDDITRLQVPFPPDFTEALTSISFPGVSDPTLITFAIRPHENGDRLLLVRMPDQRLTSEPQPNTSTTKSDSAEEQIIRRGVRFFVELDQPLLRTNAPARKANRATILDLDLDRMINGMDDPKIQRMMSPGSFQEILWQMGELPGAVVPVDHEIFLEYEAPQAPPQPPPAPAVQAPPDTEIYLAPMKTANGAIGPAVDITNNPGYDNQPFFTPDGKAILFTSVRGSGTQTDIYKYDIAAKMIAQVTNTPESEYSPTITPAGKLSVIRVELDAGKTQRLWQFTADGRDPQPVLETIKPVGYHAWADHQTLALFVLGATTGPGQSRPRRCNLPTRVPARPSCSPATSAAQSSGFRVATRSARSASSSASRAATP
jgi:hypothetical protein